MSCFGNREILIEYYELPKVNGQYIESIYLKAFDTRGVKDYTVRPEYASYYYLLMPYFSSDEPIRTRTLPKELAAIFDNILECEMQYSLDGEKHKIKIKPTSMWYRTHDSGHGGFIDESISITGATLSGGRNKSIQFTRNSKCDFDMKPDHPIAQLMLNTLNIDVQVDEMEECEYTYYPSTTLRKVDGLNYPTPVCSGWRKFYEMPYVSCNNKKTLRVLNESIKAHVYLSKVDIEEIEIGKEYVKVSFGSWSDSNPNKYCYIKSWNGAHTEDPNGMIHYRVDKIRKDKYYDNMVLDCTIIDQKIKKYSEAVCYPGSLYEIIKIKHTNDLDN